jgi:hypothetical protein
MSKQLIAAYELFAQHVTDLEKNFGVLLWIEWQKSDTFKRCSSPEYNQQLDSQLIPLSHFLVRRGGFNLLKLKEEFNRRSQSKLRYERLADELQFGSGSPLAMAPRQIFNLIADLAASDELHLIR